MNETDRGSCDALIGATGPFSLSFFLLMTLTGRVGRFFVLLGALLLAIFFASDLADTPRFNIFFWGFICSISGVILWRKGRVPPEPSNRFRYLRSLRNRGKEKGDDNSEGGDGN